MSKDKSTITGGMELPQNFIQTSQEMIIEAIESTEYISDALLSLGEKLRDQTLGECDASLSEYERKLILLGFVAGDMKATANLHEKLEMLGMMKEFIDSISKLK